MSSITIADKKFLTNLVKESFLQEMAWPPQHGSFGQDNHLISSFQTIGQKHEQELNKILSNLSAEAKWVFSTEPEPSKGVDNPIEFQENQKIADLMAELKTLKVGENEEESIKNIHTGLTSFVNAVGSSDILANLDGTRWGDEEYASLAYKNLKTSYSFGGSMDHQITKILNFRGNRHWGATFEDFYVANLNEINMAGDGQAAVHYCAWKVAEDQEFKKLVSTFAMALGILLPLLGLGPITAWLGSKWGFIVDFILFDLVLTEALDGASLGGNLRVSVTYQDAAKDWIELKKYLEDLDPEKRQEKVVEAEVQKYQNGQEMIRKLFQAYVGKWEIAAAESKAPQAAAAFREIKDMAIEGVERSNRDLVSTLMSKDLLLQTINEDLETFRGFFQKNNEARQIILHWKQALLTQWEKLKNPRRRLQGTDGPRLDPLVVNEPRTHSAGGRPVKEIKGLDTAGREFKFDKKINILLGRRPANVATGDRDIGTRDVEYLTTAFLSLHSNWKKYNVNLDGKVATGELRALWDTLRRDFTAYKSRANNDNSINPGIHEIMTRGWCMFSSMPVLHLFPDSFDEPTRYLFMGIIAISPGESAIGSFLGSEARNQAESLAEMIRYGAIGVDANGVLVKPEHAAATIKKCKNAASQKSENAKALLDKMGEDLQEGSPIYKKRKEFLTAYSDFYSNMGRTLEACVDGKLTGECGGRIGKDIFKTFAIVREWERKLDLISVRG